MGYDTLAEWDHAALYWINGNHHPVLDRVLIVVSSLGDVGAVWIVTGLLLIIFGRGRTRVTGLLLLGAMLVTDRFGAWVLGGLLDRGRPYLQHPGIRQMGVRWTGNSFPSAHAHSVMIATILLGSDYRRLLPGLIPFALLSMYSRPYLGMHHPLDVVVGAGLGALAGVGAVAVRRWWVGEPPAPSGIGEARAVGMGRDRRRPRDRDPMLSDAGPAKGGIMAETEEQPVAPLTLANALTLARLVLLPIIIAGVATGRGALAAWAMGVVVLTDLVDGRVARRLGQASSFGRTLDSTVDFVLIYSLFIAFYAAGRIGSLQFGVLYVGMLTILGLQLVSGGTMGGEVLARTRLGKPAGALQYLYLLLLVGRGVARESPVLAAADTIVFAVLAVAVAVNTVECVVRLRR